MKLSRQQQAVMNRILLGKTSKEIALEMKLAVPTVKMHTRFVLDKLGARNRTKAAAIYVRLAA